ncbi:MAG: replication/maintenance protein RepL [Clostridium sp.]
MRLASKIPSMYRDTGEVKEVSTAAHTPNNFRKIFPSQTYAVLSMFANQSTQILLYLLANADSNNMIFCTYENIMENCGINDKKVIAKVLKTLKSADAIAEVSISNYLLNPAIQVQGNNQKYGMLALEFNSIVHENKIKIKNKSKNTNKNKEKTL